MAELIFAMATLSTAALGFGQTASERADQLVQSLGALPLPMSAIARSDGSLDAIEEKRRQLYAALRELGEPALPALSRGLANPDVRLRRHVAFFLLVISSNWYTFDPPRQKLDILPTLPTLMSGLRDTDSRVRELSAQAIGNIGPNAAPAVPALVTLLADPREGSRNSACVGLYGIGPAARDALPALRKALSDSSPDVRRFAQRAIDKIEVPR